MIHLTRLNRIVLHLMRKPKKPYAHATMIFMFLSILKEMEYRSPSLQTRWALILHFKSIDRMRYTLNIWLSFASLLTGLQFKKKEVAK